MMKPDNKHNATRTSFAAQEITFNGEEAFDALEILEDDESTLAAATAAKKPKSTEQKKNNRPKSTKQGHRINSSEDKSNCTHANQS